MPRCGGMSPQMISQPHRVVLTFVPEIWGPDRLDPDHLGGFKYFQPYWGKIPILYIFQRGGLKPPTSHPWFVSVAWVLLLAFSERRRFFIQLQHIISPTIARSRIYLLAISRHCWIPKCFGAPSTLLGQNTHQRSLPVHTTPTQHPKTNEKWRFKVLSPKTMDYRPLKKYRLWVLILVGYYHRNPWRAYCCNNHASVEHEVPPRASKLCLYMLWAPFSTELADHWKNKHVLAVASWFWRCVYDCLCVFTTIMVEDVLVCLAKTILIAQLSGDVVDIFSSMKLITFQSPSGGGHISLVETCWNLFQPSKSGKIQSHDIWKSRFRWVVEWRWVQPSVGVAWFWGPMDPLFLDETWRNGIL